MTIVGSVEYDVLGVVNEGAFQKSIDTPLNRQAARAGDRFGTLLGRGVVAGMEKAASAAGTVFGTVFPHTAQRLFDPAGEQIGEQLGRDIGDGSGRELRKRGQLQGISFGKLVRAGITAGIGVESLYSGFRLVEGGILGSIQAAGDLNTEVARTERLFGDASAQVQAFAADSKRNLLATQQEALATENVFGRLLSGAGVDPSKAAALSVQLTGMAENLSALHKVPVSETFAALEAGVAGNVGPLRDLGIELDSGRVRAEAYAEGLARPVKDAAAIQTAQLAVATATANLSKVQREHGEKTLAAAEAQDKLARAQDALARATAGTNAPLTENQSLLARTFLLLRDTQGTLGAAASNTDDFSVASQQLHAELGKVSTELGDKLLPFVLDGERKFSRLIDEWENGVGAGGKLREMAGTLGTSMHQLGDIFGVVATGARDFGYGFLVVSRGILDVLGVITSVSDKVFHTHLHDDVNQAITKIRELQSGIEEAARGATVPIHVVITESRGTLTHAKGFIGPTVAEGLAAQGVNGPFTPQQTGATAVAKAAAEQRAVDAAAAKAVKDSAERAAAATQYQADQYAAFQEAQREAIQTAEDAARAHGEAITKGLQAQIETLRATESKLDGQRRKILDFRASVVAQAGQFTALTSLVDDPSRATAGGILGSLQARNQAEALFDKNLRTLGERKLDKGVLAELAVDGPQQRALASALAAGSDAQIKAINAAERVARGRAASLGNLATEQGFGPNAIARLTKQIQALEVQQRRTNKLLEAEPALIAKAVDAAGKGVKAQQRTASRTAVPR